jgi:ATP-dependent DNA ligase
MVFKRRLPAGFVVPAQPVEREKPPTGAAWIHEIKHDGYRMIVRKEAENVRLYSRKAFDWTARLSDTNVNVGVTLEQLIQASYTVERSGNEDEKPLKKNPE